MFAAGRRGRTLDLGFAALAAAHLGAAVALVPRENVVALPGAAALGGSCLSQALLGVDCPFCGMTRSFVAVAHGQLGAAVGFHPAGPVLFVAMLLFVAAAVAVAARRALPLFERRRFLVVLEAVALACMATGVFNMVRS